MVYQSGKYGKAVRKTYTSSADRFKSQPRKAVVRKGVTKVTKPTVTIKKPSSFVQKQIKDIQRNKTTKTTVTRIPLAEDMYKSQKAMPTITKPKTPTFGERDTLGIRKSYEDYKLRRDKDWYAKQQEKQLSQDVRSQIQTYAKQRGLFPKKGKTEVSPEALAGDIVTSRDFVGKSEIKVLPLRRVATSQRAAPADFSRRIDEAQKSLNVTNRRDIKVKVIRDRPDFGLAREYQFFVEKPEARLFGAPRGVENIIGPEHVRMNQLSRSIKQFEKNPTLYTKKYPKKSEYLMKKMNISINKKI